MSLYDRVIAEAGVVWPDNVSMGLRNLYRKSRPDEIANGNKNAAKAIKSTQSAVEKLVINKGLKGKRVNLAENWNIALGYDHGQKKFVISLGFRAPDELAQDWRYQKVALGDDDVVTRSRSQWLTDRVYRLTPAAVMRIVSMVKTAIEQTRQTFEAKLKDRMQADPYTGEE